MLNYDHSFKYHAVVVKVQANLQQAKQKAEEALEKKAVAKSILVESTISWFTFDLMQTTLSK